MALAGAVFLTVTAVWLFILFKTPARLAMVLTISRQATAQLRDADLTDDQKEALMQKQSLQMFGLFFLIVASLGGALLAPTGVLWLLDRLKILSLEAVFKTTMSVSFLVGCTLVGVLASLALGLRRRRAR